MQNSERTTNKPRIETTVYQDLKSRKLSQSTNNVINDSYTAHAGSRDRLIAATYCKLRSELASQSGNGRDEEVLSTLGDDKLRHRERFRLLVRVETTSCAWRSLPNDRLDTWSLRLQRRETGIPISVEDQQAAMTDIRRGICPVDLLEPEAVANNSLILDYEGVRRAPFSRGCAHVPKISPRS